MTEYSHSRLSNFENCPKKFEYRYILKIETKTEGIEGFLGKRVHEILERLYHHVSRHGRPPSLAQVQERFRKDWTLHWHEDVHIVRSENAPDHYIRIGESCLENYYRGHYPFDQSETLALEEWVTLRLDAEGRYRARGVIDRLSRRRDGTYEIHDYKTGSRLPRQSQLEQDRQLGLYQIGIEQRFPDADRIELIWHYVAFNRTLTCQRSAAQLDELRDRTIQLIDTIESATEYPARPGPLCRWCEYRDRCPEGPGRRRDSAPSPTAPPPQAAIDSADTAAPGQLSLLD